MAMVVDRLPESFLTKVAYAKSRGISVMALNVAIAEGRVSQVKDGLIDPEVADREWAANTGLQRGMRGPNPSPGGTGGGLVTLTGIRTEHEQLKLELTRAELEEKRGNQVPKETVARVLEVEGRRLRDAVFQVPVQVAAELAACSDPQGCKLIVHEAIRAALEDLAQSEIREVRSGQDD